MTEGPSAPGPAALPTEEYDRQWRLLPDYIRYHPGARHRRRLILKWVRGLGCHRILDVGCGPGELVDLLRRRLGRCELAGCDVAPDLIEANRKRFPTATFHVLDIEQGRLDERFDLVVCSEVIEHVEDQAAAFGNLADMVTPGGHLLVTCPTGKIHPTEVHFGHISHPSRQELLELGRANGLRTVRCLNWGWPIYRALKHATNINARWAIEHFAERDYSAASKLLSHALYWLNFLNFDSPHGVSLFVLFQRKS